MLNILEKTSGFDDTWNYTFLIVAIVAIVIGTIITVYKILKSDDISNRERIKLLHDEKVLDDPESLLKKK